MTIEEFIEKLAKTNYKWFVETGSVRASIQVSKSDESRKDEVCPITAVALDEIQTFFPAFNVVDAGQRIGLSLEDCGILIMIADGVHPMDVPDYPNYPALRARIMEACHLVNIR